MVSCFQKRLTVALMALGARTSAFHVPAVSRNVLPSSSNKMMQGQGSSCVASRGPGHRQRSCSQLEAKKKKKSALKGPASDALAQLELLEALEAEMQGVCVCFLCLHLAPAQHALQVFPLSPSPPLPPPLYRARAVEPLGSLPFGLLYQFAKLDTDKQTHV